MQTPQHSLLGTCLSPTHPSALRVFSLEVGLFHMFIYSPLLSRFLSFNSSLHCHSKSELHIAPLYIKILFSLPLLILLRMLCSSRLFSYSHISVAPPPFYLGKKVWTPVALNINFLEIHFIFYQHVDLSASLPPLDWELPVAAMSSLMLVFP